jgi:hypothetical protein
MSVLRIDDLLSPWLVILLSIIGFCIGAIGVLLTPVVCVTVLLLW